jgi:hypothetical protein
MELESAARSSLPAVPLQRYLLNGGQWNWENLPLHLTKWRLAMISVEARLLESLR